jgi:hypothetical protein
MGGEMTQQSRFVVEQPEVNQKVAASGRFIVGEVDEEAEEKPIAERPQGFFKQLGNWVKGTGKITPEMENLPTIVNSGFLKGQPASAIAKIAPLVAMTNDPMEIAQIIQANVPGVRMQENKDGLGNVYPILINEDGVTALVDKPGLDLMNLGQFATQTAAFMTGPGASTMPKAIAKDAAIESAIQAAQAAGGGEFDVGDIATTAAFAGGGKLLEDAAGAGAKALFGRGDELAESVIKAGDEFNVPVMTSDIYNPKNWASRGARFTGETVPVIGTGGMRNAQQEAREHAVEQFINLHQGGTYDEIIASIGRNNDRLKRLAGTVYQETSPKLDALSVENGLPLENTVSKLDAVIADLTRPGKVVDDSVLSILDDMQTMLTGPDQTYQLLRDNIGAWQAKIDSIDPAVRAAMPSKVKSQLQSILSAARRDRDMFANANLTSKEYAQLKQADSLYGEVAENLKSTKIKNILDKGDVTPEVAAQMLYSNKPSEVKRLYENLTPAGRANTKSLIIQDIVDALDKRAGGITPTTLVNELRKRSDATSVFFKGADKEQLDGFMRLMEHTRRAQEVAKGAGSQTAERVMPLAAGASLAFDPAILAGYATVGGLSRVIESPRMRGILVKMNGTAPGTPEFKRLAELASTIFRAGLQASPEKGGSDLEKEISEEGRRTFRALQ